MGAQPTTIGVRIGEDFNWWIDQLEESAVLTPSSSMGILDPRQVRHLLDHLPTYQEHGLALAQFSSAFQAYALDAEVGEGHLRLEITAAALAEDAEMFAMPLVADEDEGPFYDFLDALANARIKLLNETHDYARDCTLDDMQEELAALDQDRFFSGSSVHVFDQINEILEWHPAEWNEAD